MDRAVEAEEEIMQADGLHTYITVKCPLRDGTGRLYAVCGISTDITERKRVEEQLRQAQKMEAIGQLAGGIAHDFNNILTAINGYSAMGLEMMDAGHPLHRVMRQINQSGERAAVLTRQLLAYSRKQVLEPKVWDVNVIVADMEGMLKPLIGENIELMKELAREPAWVKVDRGQLEQIVMNLCVNARDAMANGGKLMLETGVSVLHAADPKSDGKPGPHVVLSISDTGHGMPPDVKSKIFEPFFTTKEVGKGTGLGLSVVYGIVKQSHGSITVYSEPGQGTVFRIYLPEAGPEGRPVPESPPPKDMSSYRGKETVLLVEDEEFVRQFTRAALESKGYSVVEAGNGVQALAALADPESSIDLVVTDVVMPDMGGQALAGRIRGLKTSPPILFISGYSEAAMARNGIIESGEDFIQKPFTPHDLARKIREVLDR
jgi:two-component system cell cycle sensor histidine kinase/response regulator CckA